MTSDTMECVDPDGCHDGDAMCSACWTAVEVGYIESVATWLETRARLHQRSYNTAGAKWYRSNLSAMRGECESLARKLRDGTWREEQHKWGATP